MKKVKHFFGYILLPVFTMTEESVLPIFRTDTIINPQPVVYRAQETITSCSKIYSGNIYYIAGSSICLEPGFEVQIGAEFSALVVSEPCEANWLA